MPKVLFYCVYASSFCMNCTFDQLMILYLTFLAMCILWKFCYILWCMFSKKSVRLVVHFVMVYLTMYIPWRVYMTRCAMRKCCLVICIYALLLSVTIPMLFFLLILLFACTSGYVSTCAWVRHFSATVLVILYVWISSFHHLINGWVPIWYINCNAYSINVCVT